MKTAPDGGGTSRNGVRLTVRLALGGIAASWIIALAGAVASQREVQIHVRLISDNALASVRLVNRISVDVQRRRLLLDRYVWEARADVRTHLAEEMAAIRGDYLAAAAAYEPLATFPAEAETWRRLKAEVEALQGPIEDALTGSRGNADVAPLLRPMALDPQFAIIERDIATVLDINTAAAQRSVLRIRQLQGRSQAVQVILTILALASTLGLVVWVTGLLSQNETQARANALALEITNRELDAFAGRVAHDLRNPLSNMGLAASVLVKRLPEAAPQITVLRRAIARMTSLIEDLLTLSRVASLPQDAVSDVHAVADSVAEELAAEVRGAAGILRIDVASASVRCDAGLLRQVLLNLGENALKYRRPEVRLEIVLEGRANGDPYELCISDNGLGMSEEVARRAFEPFYRGEPTAGMPGTGLGLSIVKRVVEASGGSISLRSRVGQGTTFVVGLPLAGQSSPAA
jgi:signal transduction histidine kinase